MGMVLTLGWPLAFSIVNFYKGWYTAGFGGICAMLGEFCLLVSAAFGRQEVGRLFACLWLMLAGVVACIRLCVMVARRRGLLARPLTKQKVQSLQPERFVLPPLLPPTIS